MDWKQELLKRLDALADKLGTTGAYLWQVLVRQAVLGGVADSVVAVFLGVAAYLAFKYARYCYGKYIESSQKDRYYPSEGWIAGYILLGIACAGLALASTLVAHDAILELMNPAFYALKEVLSSVK